MIRSLFVLALLLAAPLAAQAPAGLQMRVDESTEASDPDDVPEVRITTAANGFEVRTGPAAVLFNPANTATGNYTLRGTFRLNSRSSHTNYYGLVLGGRELQGANQNYLYFLVAQNGQFLIKHRMGEMVHDIVPATRNPAVVGMPAEGPASTNALEVRVGTNVDFVVNGTVVHSVPKTSLAGATDGIWGVRINHVIPSVTVEGLGVTRQ
jgi:hypothetical protein